jgi:hypothetical protein
MVAKNQALEHFLQSFLKSDETLTAANLGKSPGSREPPELRARHSELVLWSGQAGLFYNDFLIVTTQRVISKHGGAWTLLRLSEIDTVDASQAHLSLTARGTTHRVDFRKEEVANEVASIIFESMLRQ